MKTTYPNDPKGSHRKQNLSINWWLNPSCSMHGICGYSRTNLHLLYALVVVVVVVVAVSTTMRPIVVVSVKLIFYYLATRKCRPGEFRCVNEDKCVPVEWRCDGEEDCADGSDEGAACEKSCGAENWRCSDGTCIHKDWKCDGEADCDDASDEKNCKKSKRFALSVKMKF